MTKGKNYYSFEKKERSAVINIFGDITSHAFEDFGEVSNVILSKKLEELDDVDTIDVYINSYGGEVAEGLAIYNALKRQKAKITTHIDGFACSIASVIFMAGDERIMPDTSLLMIHNPWTWVKGNANDLRKQADDLDKMAECSINAYQEKVNIDKEKIKELLDNETWLSAKDALDMGFATKYDDTVDSNNPSQSIKSRISEMLLKQNKKKEEYNTTTSIEEKKHNVLSEKEEETKEKFIERVNELVDSFFVENRK